MLVSTYHLSDTERVNARRQWVDARPLVIGSGARCHVVIDDPEVADQHLCLSIEEGAILVENLGPAADVDGTPLPPNGRIRVGESRPIRIGGTVVKLRMQQVPVVSIGGPLATPDPEGGMPPSPPRPTSELPGARASSSRPQSELPGARSSTRPSTRPSNATIPRPSNATIPRPSNPRPSSAPPQPSNRASSAPPGPPTSPPRLPVVTTNPGPRDMSNPPLTMPSNPPLFARQRPPRPDPPIRPRQELLAVDPTEQQFLTALRANPQDMATRMVYADWLEERGLKAKLELLKLAEYLDTFIHKNACDIDWRVVAVRTPIEHCMHNKCPKSWDALALIDIDEFVRKCGTCKKQVAYCGTLLETRAAAFDESPVVFDVALDRVAAHAAYRHFEDEPFVANESSVDEPEDDPDGYTLDVPPSNYRR